MLFFISLFVWFGLATIANVEPRKLLPIPDAARRLGIGRTKLYELLAAGVIPSVRIGTKRRLVPVEALDAYADSLTRETSLESNS